MIIQQIDSIHILKKKTSWNWNEEEGHPLGSCIPASARMSLGCFLCYCIHTEVLAYLSEIAAKKYSFQKLIITPNQTQNIFLFPTTKNVSLKLKPFKILLSLASNQKKTAKIYLHHNQSLLYSVLFYTATTRTRNSTNQRFRY